MVNGQWSMRKLLAQDSCPVTYRRWESAIGNRESAIGNGSERI